MAKRVIYGRDAEHWAWLRAKIPDLVLFNGGVTITIEDAGKVIAVAGYDGYDGASIQMHIASEPGARWMTHEALYSAFAYPFMQLKVRRITGFVRQDNIQAQKFDEHLGFVREGLMRQGCKDGTDMIMYGMLKEECRFLRYKK